MSMRYILAVLVFILFTLTGCGADTPQTAPPPSDVADKAVEKDPATILAEKIERGRQAFSACAQCHFVTPDGRHMLGPNLYGVYGYPAAQYSDFIYSKALRTANLTWDDETLDAYIANPQAVVPNTKMAYAGMRNPKKRDALIAYLKSLSEESDQ